MTLLYHRWPVSRDWRRLLSHLFAFSGSKVVFFVGKWTEKCENRFGFYGGSDAEKKLLCPIS